jgi:type IX secretion system PorP/SprF family membrane protein
MRQYLTGFHKQQWKSYTCASNLRALSMALSRLFITASLSFGFLSMAAQDAHFTQFYANPIYLNPAFAGVSQCPKVNVNYRNQYPTLGVYQTTSASYDQYVDALNGGVGVLMLQDEAANGALSLTEVSLAYSYHLTVTREFSVVFGAQGTFRQRLLDWGNLTFPDQIDPFYGFVKPTNEIPPGSANVLNSQNFDLTFGILGFTDNFYMGATFAHVTEPNEAFLSNNSLPMKFTGQLGAVIPIGRKRLYNDLDNLLIPHAVFQSQGGAMQLTSGISFNRGLITGGLAYRQAMGALSSNPDAIVAIIGIAPNDMPWTFGYSYDYTISSLKNTLGGAHEISMSYQFPCRAQRSRSRGIKCPKF